MRSADDRPSSPSLNCPGVPTLRPRMNSSVFKIAALAGDGIGPEVMREAIKVLAPWKRIWLPRRDHRGARGLGRYRCRRQRLAGCHARIVPPVRRESCLARLACPTEIRRFQGQRPERAALLRIRKEIRALRQSPPVQLPKALAHACPLRQERQGDGIDILVVRGIDRWHVLRQPKKTRRSRRWPEARHRTRWYTPRRRSNGSRIVAFQAARNASRQGDQHRQGQCARRTASSGGMSSPTSANNTRRKTGPHVRGQRGDATDAQAHAI